MCERMPVWQGSTFRPSELQSEIGQPWSRVEKGQAPLLMCRYQATSGPGQSSLTCLHQNCDRLTFFRSFALSARHCQGVTLPAGTVV